MNTSAANRGHLWQIIALPTHCSTVRIHIHFLQEITFFFNPFISLFLVKKQKGNTGRNNFDILLLLLFLFLWL